MYTEGAYQRRFTNDDEPLDHTYNTRDEARIDDFAVGHPYFFTESKAKVQEWLLGLRSSDDLFSSGAVVPNGVDKFKGQQWSTVFKLVKSHFTYFKDDGANRLITTHLDNLDSLKNKFISNYYFFLILEVRQSHKNPNQPQFHRPPPHSRLPPTVSKFPSILFPPL